MDYGSANHQGVLALYEDSEIEIGESDSRNIYNTVHIREQVPTNGAEQYYMTLNAGSTLRFIPGSHLTNEGSADGCIRLNVYINGGTLDDSGLRDDDKMLINRIYNDTEPGTFVLTPVPAQGLVQATCDASRYNKFILTNAFGQTQATYNLSAPVFSVDVGNFSNDIYFLQAQGSNGFATAKLIKQ